MSDIILSPQALYYAFHMFIWSIACLSAALLFWSFDRAFTRILKTCKGWALLLEFHHNKKEFLKWQQENK